MYSCQYLEFAMCGISILVPMLFVAIAAFFANIRLMFLLGSLGCFLGHVVPMSQRTSMTFESSLNWTASHILFWGVTGGLIGCLLAAVITNQLQKQFSIRALIISTTAVALAIALAKRFVGHW